MSLQQLADVSLSEYKNLTGFEEWLQNDVAVPSNFLEKITVSSPDASVKELIEVIRKTLFNTYGGDGNKANSFEESRFTPVDQIIERKISSCGALTNVVGSALREFGVPVQFVHGRLTTQHGGNRHAWLKVYKPEDKSWVTIDVTNQHFAMYADAEESKIYHNWSELKEDYDRGEW